MSPNDKLTWKASSLPGCLCPKEAMKLEAVHTPAKSAGPYHAGLPFLCLFLQFSYLPFAQLSPLRSGRGRAQPCAGHSEGVVWCWPSETRMEPHAKAFNSALIAGY